MLLKEVGVLNNKKDKSIVRHEYYDYLIQHGYWKMFVKYSDSINFGELAHFLKFEEYHKVYDEIDKVLVEFEACGGIKISGKTNNFVNGIIGSVSKKESGVETDAIKTALQTEPIRDGENYRYILNGVCEVFVNIETGKLIKVYPLPKSIQRIEITDKQKMFLKLFVWKANEYIEKGDLQSVLRKISGIIVKYGLAKKKEHLKYFARHLNWLYYALFDQNKED